MGKILVTHGGQVGGSFGFKPITYIKMETNESPIVLTGNERKVLLLICSNYRCKEIATLLEIDFETVQTACKSLRKLFGANQMPAVVFRAVVLELLTKEELRQAMSTWNRK